MFFLMTLATAAEDSARELDRGLRIPFSECYFNRRLSKAQRFLKMNDNIRRNARYDRYAKYKLRIRKTFVKMYRRYLLRNRWIS